MRFIVLFLKQILYLTVHVQSSSNNKNFFGCIQMHLKVVHCHTTPHVRAALRCNHGLRVAVHPFKRRITRAQLAQPLLQLVNSGFLAAGGGGKAEGCSYERRVDGERWGGQGRGVLIRPRV